MNWYKLKFPEDVDPFDDPQMFLREAETIYRKNNSPRDFCVFQEIDEDASCIIYLSPVAAQHCQQDGLFGSYRKIHPCEKPMQRRKPITAVVGEYPLCQHML